ncbi:MAG: GatB/YqeY domain-containing protein [Chloroflexaceae bacterium]|nr:GatB/YqeY domain-containing protein [Chloroflexaceae bacterium]NJL32695.1 GatB/YqeY domain-containing protein [Chloroflexaceae bacterium]NJO04544.1 GatB/YqeY domain-containing protein [Chloroflexaceae bacterium]
MSIQEQLAQDLKEAMKARDRLRVDVIRNARAALQQAQLDASKQRYDAAAQEIEQRFAGDTAAIEAALNALPTEQVSLTDEEQQQVLAREVKKRRDTADMYRKVNEQERAEQEEAEARILETYLPKQLDAEELRPQIAALIAEHGLSGPADMGKLMPILMERFKGRADGRTLSQLAREQLSSS